jgi:CBS domain containing-hemolysin-like protein
MKTVSYPLWLIVSILKPVTRFMEIFSWILMKLLPSSEEEDYSPDINELMIMARYSAKAGYIDEIERKLVVRATRFNDLEARDVMIPRQQVVGVPEEISLQKLQEEFQEHKLSRIPVFSGETDHVAGIFNFKELLSLCHQSHASYDSNFNILDHCHEPFFVPESVQIGQLFDSMKQKKTHMAVVVDEFGQTSGIVTLEDIIERVFGLIHDEYDEESVQTIEKINEHEYMLKGRTSIEDLENTLGYKLPEEVSSRINTVNGLLTYIKGDFPEKREKISLDNIEFRVEEVKKMRATRIRALIKKKS